MTELAIILIPLAGTSVGAAMVFFMKEKMDSRLEKALLGFASGVMIAASVWSLLNPAIEMTREQGGKPWLTTAVGFLLGIGFLLGLECMVPHLHPDAGGTDSHRRKAVPERGSETDTIKADSGYKESGSGESGRQQEKRTGLDRTGMLILAVSIHNLPEGMAVGVALAGAILENTGMTMAGAFVLAAGIAIQNFPEGAIISMPLRNTGVSRSRAFWYGVLSGVVEPVGAAVTILLAEQVVRILPYLLAFAAGAMIYVVADELIPEAQDGRRTNLGTVGVALGFVLMMVLDVALG